MVRYLTVLDTGAGPNLIVESTLAPQLRSLIRFGTVPDVADAINNPLRTVGNMDLVVRLRRSVVKLCFIICRSMAGPVVLRFDYCGRFVEAVRPRPKQVKPKDASSVPSVPQPLKRGLKKPVSLPAAQERPLKSQ